MTNNLLETEKDPGTIALVSGGSSGDFSNFAPIKDIKDFCSATQDSGWQGEFSSAASLGASAVSMAFHPIATVTGWVTSWIIDHLHPLQDMLQEFTGDSDEINAGSSTWTNISNASGNNAADLESLLGKIEDQKSKTLDAYRKKVDTLKQVFETQKEAAAQIADTLKQQAAIADFIYGMIRDAISEAIGEFFEDVAIEVFSLGTGTPLVVAKITARVGEKVAEITKYVNKALDAFAKLSKITEKLVQGLRGLVKMAQKLTSFINKANNPLKMPAKEAGKKAAEQVSKHLPHAAGRHVGRHAGQTARHAAQASINAENLAHGTRFFEAIGDTASAVSNATKKDGEGMYTKTPDNYKGLYQDDSSNHSDNGSRGSGSSSSSDVDGFYEGGGSF